jgi:hypothetical protein
MRTGPLPFLLRRVIMFKKLGYLVTDSFAPVPTLSIVEFMLVNTFTQLSYGLRLGLSYKMSQDLRSLLKIQFHVIGVAQFAL